MKLFIFFPKLLRPDVRLQYLTRVHDFMKTDNTRNWRFREELAEYVQHSNVANAWIPNFKSYFLKNTSSCSHRTCG